MGKVSIRARLTALVLVAALGFAVLGWLAKQTLASTRVGGPIYDDVVLGKDLVADILPPPLYILESYFVVLDAIEEPDQARREATLSKLGQLRKDFTARHEFWVEKLAPGELKDALLKEAYTPAKEFYKILDEELLPPLSAGNRNKAREVSRGPLRAAYDAHREAIDRTVQLANEANGAREAASLASVESSVTRMIAVVGIVLSLFMAIGALVGWSIVQPLQPAIDILQDLAQGEGDLTKRLDANRSDEIGTLARWFNQFMDKLHSVIGEVAQSATQTRLGADQLAAAANHLADSTQTYAASLEETSATVRELTGAVKSNASNTRDASRGSTESLNTARGGGEVVTAAVRTMGEIDRASKQIAEIVNVIDDIAFQTNLLALNASVEAARAGSQGAGFAVVAAEVRNLAQRSSEAAKQIRTLIADSTAKVGSGSELVNKSGAAFEEMIASLHRFNSIMGEIESASSEQATGFSQIETAIERMDQSVQASAAETEQLSATALNLAQEGERLDRLVGRFRLS